MASITKRPDGRWRGRYRDADGREHARHFTRKVDGQRWLDEVTASVVTGHYVDPNAGRVTFLSFYGGWSERQDWAPGTRRAMDLAVRSMTFVDTPLRAVRRSHVEQSIKAMDVRGLAPGTVKTRFNNARAVLRAAVADRLIASDPSDGVALPRQRRADAAMQLPTVSQVAALLACADPSFRAFVALAAFAGPRLGEIAALRVSDVDFLRRTLVVQRQVQRVSGGNVEIRPPKYGSERTVFLADDLVTIVAQHVEQRRPGDDPDRWLFSGEGPNPWHQNTVGHHWRRTRTAAGLPWLTLHNLRHFYASGLIAAGCDVVTVQRALGHAKATTTLNTYAHLWPTAEDRTRRAAADLIAAAFGAADSTRTELAE